jgi:2-desacetyl-2-hydroxyethyl bacteriochlorophyllide A dehydrogenase
MAERMVTIQAPGEIALVEYEERAPGVGEVLVRTLYSGVSAGTELTAYRGTNPYLQKRWDEASRLFVEGDPTFPYPLDAWGYEQVGRVEALGGGVTGFADGDLVWGAWGHRSAAVVPESRLARRVLPDAVDPLCGVFVRIAAVALNAVLDADVHVGETVAVFGQGVPGLLATQLARLNGGTVVAVDRLRRRLELAEEFGATVVDATTTSAAEAIKRMTDGRGADVVIELTGSSAALHEAIRATAYAARVVVAGFGQGEAAGLRLGEEFHHNRIELVSSQIANVPARLTPRWTTLRLERTIVDLHARGRLELASLVSHVIPAGQVADAFRLLDEHPDETVQVVLDFS